MELDEKSQRIDSYFNLEWKNLSYIPRKRIDKKYFNIFKRTQEREVRVLDNGKFSHELRNSDATGLLLLKLFLIFKVNGSIESGSLVAVIGGSGCGKTSLLAAIAQRIRQNLSGEIFINGQLVDPHEMRIMSGYVPQSDISIPTITPYEHLYFMVIITLNIDTTRCDDDQSSLQLQFKNGGNLTKDERAKKIHSILRTLSLTSCTFTPIKCLSGGEKRKLLFATSLIFDPFILFCDEITTGLDSFQASSVIQSLRTLVGLDQTERFLNTEKVITNKNAVICSVHQPSSSIFQLFSHLILMSNGQIIFQGKVEEAVGVFEKAGMPCPTLYNPAEFYVKMVSLERNEEKIARVLQICEENKIKMQENKSQSEILKKGFSSKHFRLELFN